MARKSRVVGVSNFSPIFSDLIRQFGADVYDALEEAIDETAKEAAARLRTSPMPFDTRTGKYQKAWTWKAMKQSIISHSATVYNSTEYRRAHLLEFGHAIKRGGRKVGDAEAKPHIADVNKWADEEVFDKFLDKMSRK